MDLILLTKSNIFIIGPVASLLGYIMDIIFKMTEKFGFVNIGWSIIIFTVTVNILMIPLNIKQQKSSRMMNIMQPEIQAIRKKYEGKKDTESQMMMNSEVSEVYKKYGTSMTGGCVQLLIQMPILFGLYQVIYKIPAYVKSVYDLFYNIASNIMTQKDYISNLTEFAKIHRMPVDKIDYNQVDRVIDLLYKFRPDEWNKLSSMFPNMNDIFSTNLESIHKMNMFMGIDISTNPWQGIIPNLAWIIPILAGLTQWYSTKLLSSNQTVGDDGSAMAQQMKTMNNIMPLMSVWFGFTLPAGIGIYWVASGVCRIVQQLIINKHLDKIDVDELIAKNIEINNKKRAKKGLSPQTINKNAYIKADKEKLLEEKRKSDLENKKINNTKYIKDSTEYYNKDAKEGSLTAKANMVLKYNEKNKK